MRPRVAIGDNTIITNNTELQFWDLPQEFLSRSNTCPITIGPFPIGTVICEVVDVVYQSLRTIMGINIPLLDKEYHRTLYWVDASVIDRRTKTANKLAS